MYHRGTRCTSWHAAILSPVVILVLCCDARAQSTGGAFGQRNLGGSISNRQGSFGGTPSASFEQEGVGEVTGTERFVRDARQPGQFVGADSSDTQNFFSQQSNVSQLNNLPANRNANRQNAGRNGAQQNRTRILRRRLNPGFRYPQISETVVSSKINARFNRLSTPNAPLDIQVAVEGQTALLRGTVASEEERKLAETLVSLEPGVWEVRNELTVSAQRPPIPRFEQVPGESLRPPEPDSATEPAAS